INFGEDLCMHLAVPMRIKNGDVFYDDVRFGYVVENGEVYGVVSASVTAERVEMIPISTHIRVKDVRGKEYEFFGTMVSGYPWYNFNPCHVCFQSLMRYQDGNRVGYGEFGDIFGLEYLGDRLSRHARQR